MMVKLITVKDVFEVNTYFYIDEETGHGFLIDPGAQPELLLEIIRKNKWTIEKILITHGHFDHIGAVKQIHEELQIPYYIHRNGKKYAEDTFWNLSSYCDRNVKLTGAEYLEDGQQIQLSNSKEKSLQVIATPGHTTDSVIFYSEAEQLAFVGDTIFRG
ncbi:MAG: MBL fold metallo-hydrolase, partial [bacterium]|nr:MBL fold metallo-hydrolase [bacterium]